MNKFIIITLFISVSFTAIIVALVIDKVETKKNETIKVETKKNKKVNHLPLFLGLSSKMEYSDYYLCMDSLNSNHYLEKGLFVLPIGNENYLFRVSLKGNENFVRDEWLFRNGVGEGDHLKGNYISLSHEDTFPFFYYRNGFGVISKDSQGKKHDKALKEWSTNCAKSIKKSNMIFKRIISQYKNKYPEKLNYDYQFEESKDPFEKQRNKMKGKSKVPLVILGDSVKTILLFHDIGGRSKSIVSDIKNNAFVKSMDEYDRSPNYSERERKASYNEFISIEIRYYHTKDFIEEQNAIRNKIEAKENKAQDSLSKFTRNLDQI